MSGGATGAGDRDRRGARPGDEDGDAAPGTETPARRAARLRLRAKGLRAHGTPLPAGRGRERFRGLVAYDGSRFCGWQRQFEDVSVQEILEAAVEVVVGRPATVLSSGRTDAGVHAEAHPFTFDADTPLPAHAWKHVFDHLLPDEVRVLRTDRAPDDFLPQGNALRKLYRYDIVVADAPRPAAERTAWRVPPPLCDASMRAAAGFLVGVHDFRAFRSDPGPERREEDTVRALDRLAVLRTPEGVRIEAEGPGFLFRMVRNLAAGLVEVGAGRRPPEWVRDVLGARDRTLLPPSAPAAGLTLVRVDYPDGWPGVGGTPGGGFPELRHAE